MTLHKPMFAAALCATALTGVSVAEAATRAGTFRGQTTAKDPVGLKVNGSNRVYAFYFEHVRLKCDDKDSFLTQSGTKRRNHSPNKARYRISSSRRFTIDFTNPNTGFRFTIHGRFGSKGGSASGTLRVQARFDIYDEPRPNGSIHCDSGSLRWTVRRR